MYLGKIKSITRAPISGVEVTYDYRYSSDILSYNADCFVQQVKGRYSISSQLDKICFPGSEQFIADKNIYIYGPIHLPDVSLQNYIGYFIVDRNNLKLHFEMVELKYPRTLYYYHLKNPSYSLDRTFTSFYYIKNPKQVFESLCPVDAMLFDSVFSEQSLASNNMTLEIYKETVPIRFGRYKFKPQSKTPRVFSIEGR